MEFYCFIFINDLDRNVGITFSTQALFISESDEQISKKFDIRAPALNVSGEWVLI
jgi:hypothetical protein